MLSGDNGILQKATTAKENTNNGQIKERVQLAYTAAIADGNGELTESNLRAELTSEFGNDYDLSEDTTTNEWVISVSDVERLRVSKGTIGEIEIDIANLQTETTKPYLPSDNFSISNKSGEQSVNNGLVITDGTNEFVWIEVPMTVAVYSTAGIGLNDLEDSDYVKIAKDLAVYSESELSNNPTVLSDHLPPADKVGKDYTDEYKDVLESIYKNGGFYIGRYETGIQGTENVITSARDFGEDYESEHGTLDDVAVIKENIQPYTWVRWEQAISLAKGISATTKGSNHTNLLIGVQWDLVLKFLGKTGDTNSSDWGNYKDSVFDLKAGSHYAKISNSKVATTWKKYNEDETGYVESSEKKSQSSDYTGIQYTTGANITKNSKKNICDIAGNVSEWTIANTAVPSYINGPCSIRSSDSRYTGSIHPAPRKDYSRLTFSSAFIGFRVCIY